jgi:integrase/recombinase XerD
MDEKRKAGRPKGTTKPELLAMEEAQLERLFKEIERRKDHLPELAFKMAFHFGLRVTEVCRILLSDIYLGAQLSDITFTVQGIKHGRKRVYQSTEIDARLAYLMRDWIRKRRRADEKNPYLFPSRKYYDRSLTTAALKDKFKRYLKRAGLPSYFSMHSLRHSCAVHLIRGGAGPVDVMNWLRLRDISNAQKYFERMAVDMPDKVKRAFGALM